jgi:hypothetical protein
MTCGDFLMMVRQLRVIFRLMRMVGREFLWRGPIHLAGKDGDALISVEAIGVLLARADAEGK